MKAGAAAQRIAEGQGADGHSLRLVAYDALRQLIQNLELEPGRITSDSELARRLGMSRTPVREALALLERDFLVTRIPNQGVLIRELSTDEFVHLLNMREALDGMAARLSVRRMEGETLDRLEAAFREAKARGGLQAKLHAALSRDLHSAIIAATGNPFLESASSTLIGAFERSRQHGWRTWSSSGDAEAIAARRYDEHLSIIAAIRSRDPDAAERAARTHVANALRDTLGLLMR